MWQVGAARVAASVVPSHLGIAAMLLPVHILAGLVALTAGFLALGTRKGGRLHRRAGLVFVVAMLAMALAATVIAVSKVKLLSAVAGLLTVYLVATALLTVRRPAWAPRWLDAVLMLGATAVGAGAVALGLQAMEGAGTLDGQPAMVAVVFGSVALLGAALDLRMLIRGINGKHRIARHLWRMCFALLLAAASFFLGQAQVFPDALRRIELLALPVIAVLLAMLYWLLRTLVSRRRLARA